MLAFEVHLNGEKLCTAGVSGHGFVHLWLNWHRIMRRIKKGSTERELREGSSLNVGGIRRLEREKDEHIRWVSESVSVGDEIIIRVVESEQIDSPTTTTTLEELEKKAPDG